MNFYGIHRRNVWQDATELLTTVILGDQGAISDYS